MTKNQKEILIQVKAFVLKLFSEKINNRFAFHNIRHTKNVVNAAKKISKHDKLSNDDEFALISAAGFHDTGFCNGTIERHETESNGIAKKFLKNKVSNDIILKIFGCIQATRMPQKPLTVIEKIISDADLYHLGTLEYKKLSLLLKKEREEYYNKKFQRANGYETI
jgi:HD superfamily phosphodiesterase